MNILYTIFSLKTGGAEKLLVDILNNIELTENDNIYLCIINNKYDEQLINQINKNVRIIKLGRKEGSKNRIKYILKYTKFVLKEHIDVIHCQCIDGVKISLLSKIIKPKVRLIHTIHATRIYLNLNLIEVLLDKLFAYKLIAISKSVKDDIMFKGISSKKVDVIYNGIDIDKYNIERKVHDEIRIGCVARIVPSIKGQDILIRAIAIVKDKYPNVKCFFAGEVPQGKEEYLVYLKEIIKETQTEKNVVFMGNINDVPNFISDMDIFVLPSRYEGFGISLVEAMAAGIPTIASSLDGPKEIIRDNEYGLLFQPEDYKDLANKILYCLDNVKAYNESLVKKYVKKNYDIKVMVDKLYNLYLK